MLTELYFLGGLIEDFPLLLKHVYFYAEYSMQDQRLPKVFACRGGNDKPVSQSKPKSKGINHVISIYNIYLVTTPTF